MRRIRVVVLLLCAAFGAAGCGSFNCQVDRKYVGPRVYGGVRYDLFAIDVVTGKLSAGWAFPFYLDLPFSAAVDTVLLPITFVQDLAWPPREPPPVTDG